MGRGRVLTIVQSDVSEPFCHPVLPRTPAKLEILKVRCRARDENSQAATRSVVWYLEYRG